MLLNLCGFVVLACFNLRFHWSLCICFNMLSHCVGFDWCVCMGGGGGGGVFFFSSQLAFFKLTFINWKHIFVVFKAYI